MKMPSLVFALLLVSIPAAAQFPKATEVPPGEMARSDVDFMRTADAANIDQIVLGARAAGRAKNPGVHSLADNVVHSHKKADDALRLLAGVKHVELQHRQTERGQDEASELIRRDVPAERLYVEGVVRDNVDLIALYENARAHSEDPDVRSFADTMLPALRDHKRQAEDLLAREGLKSD